MYKDKNKQREANKKAQARFKARGITKQGITSEGITEREFIKEVSEIFDVPTGLKRGKDIKCFADLPPDVQQTIDKMSKVGDMINGKIDQNIKANRTAIAINYQHLFPDQYFPHDVLRLTPVGRVGDSVSDWKAANEQAQTTH